MPAMQCLNDIITAIRILPFDVLLRIRQMDRPVSLRDLSQDRECILIRIDSARMRCDLLARVSAGQGSEFFDYLDLIHSMTEQFFITELFFFLLTDRGGRGNCVL